LSVEILTLEQYMLSAEIFSFRIWEWRWSCPCGRSSKICIWSES